MFTYLAGRRFTESDDLCFVILLHDLSIFHFSRPANKNISLRVLSRVIVILSLLIIVYFSSNDDKTKSFAKQSELLAGKGQIVECSNQYLKELDKYEGCFPKECKRFVTDKVISGQEAEKLLTIAKRGLALGGSSGGASILDLHSGALSKGQHFINIYKKEEVKNLFTEEDFNLYRVIYNCHISCLLLRINSL